jgi:Tol biopolymer transport system component
MDYDGAGQKQLTHLASIALSPRISPDRSRVAFSALSRDSWQIMMYSVELGRNVAFPHFGGDNFSPAWSSDGTKVAFSSSMRENAPEIYIGDVTGAGAHRLTTGRGDVQSEDERADRVCKRTNGAAPDLHHGRRRQQRAKSDRSGVCCFTILVT